MDECLQRSPLSDTAHIFIPHPAPQKNRKNKHHDFNRRIKNTNCVFQNGPIEKGFKNSTQCHFPGANLQHLEPTSDRITLNPPQTPDRKHIHTYTNNTNPETANMPCSETIQTQQGRGMGREWRTHVGDMANHTGAVRGGLGLEQPSRQHACHRHRCNVTQRNAPQQQCR